MNKSLIKAHTSKAVREAVFAYKSKNKTIALVPTMGALHAGHISLIEVAKQHADRVICSIFVNPKQFGKNEDLESYPSTLQADCEALEQAGVDLVFIPTVQEMYPKGFQTCVSVAEISTYLCGHSRPGHFDGVTTVVSKLLLIVQPDTAIFGAKDFQQLLVIKQMVQDLNIPTNIISAPIQRAKDGLALSSRNQYLSPQDRKRAPLIYQTLQSTAQTLREGTPLDEALKNAAKALTKNGFVIDYIEARDATNLKPITGPLYQKGETPPQSAQLLCAVKLGQTRLIDNIPI